MSMADIQGFAISISYQKVTSKGLKLCWFAIVFACGVYQFFKYL